MKTDKKAELLKILRDLAEDIENDGKKEKFDDLSEKAAKELSLKMIDSLADAITLEINERLDASIGSFDKDVGFKTKSEKESALRLLDIIRLKIAHNLEEKALKRLRDLD